MAAKIIKEKIDSPLVFCHSPCMAKTIQLAQKGHSARVYRVNGKFGTFLVSTSYGVDRKTKGGYLAAPGRKIIDMSRPEIANAFRYARIQS